MAVPFYIPDDPSELEVIIYQLHSLLSKLQAAVSRSRTRRHASTQTDGIQMHGSDGSNRSRSEELPSSSASSISSVNIPSLINNLVWLAAAGQDVVISPTISSRFFDNSLTRSSIRRSSSASPCSKETKISITAIVNLGVLHDWNQIGVTIRKVADDVHPTPGTENTDDSSMSQPKTFSAEGILSKILPVAVSVPLWTAMICFVGWHLFRTR